MTMRVVVLFVILSTWSLQHVASRTNVEIKHPVRNLVNKDDLRGLSDVWDSIKNSAKNAWAVVKDFAHNTKEKIQLWTEKAKLKAKEIGQKFQDRIKDIREKSKAIIEQLVGTGQLVKECFQKENEEMEKLLEQIVQYVTSCISENMFTLSRIPEDQFSLQLNETAFLNNIENKMNECVKSKDIEECLFKTRTEMFDEMENMENAILAKGMESRGMVDDLLDTVLNCSVEGLIDASNVIAAETLRILACVMKG